MKCICLIFILALAGCATNEPNKKLSKSELHSYCPDMNKNVVNVEKGQTVEEALALFHKEEKRELDLQRQKNVVRAK